MNRILVSIPGVILAFVTAACGESTEPGDESMDGLGTAGSSSTGAMGTTTGTGGADPANTGAANTGAGTSSTSNTGGANTGAANTGAANTGTSTPGTSTGPAMPPGADDSSATDDSSVTDDSAGVAQPDDGSAVGADDGLGVMDDAAMMDDGAEMMTDDGASGPGETDDGAEMMMDDGAEPDEMMEPEPPEPEPVLITSGENNYWQIGDVTEAMGGNATVTVNDDQVQQNWDAFGGTFNEAGWDALKAVSEADRDRAIKLLFDKQDGAAFTYGRIPIGSSDYGLSRYSLNESANDFEMENFSIERDRQDLIPYIKAALAVQPDIHFWASPWSPPTWMKDNGQFDGGNMKNDPATLEAHALYLARFVEEYETEGIIVRAVHPQNEPGYLQGYPTCGWSASLMTDYIGNYLGPLFAERLPDVEVWLGTMSNPNSASIVTTVMGNGTAAGYVRGIGLQWGMGDGNQPQTYASQYQIPVMQTEHQCGNFPNGSNSDRAPNDHAYALESWGYFKKWIGKNVNSYMAWNMVLDTQGHNLDTTRLWAQNAPLVVDRQAGTLIVTPTYYLFRHMSQYVEPGSVRVATQGGDALAWKNPDGSIVTVMHNSGGQAQNTTLSVAGKMLQFEIPARGWATVNWQGDSAE